MAPREVPSWDNPCAPRKSTVIDLRYFPRCQKGEDPTAANPCRPTQANGQISLMSFAPCTAGQRPTPDLPCAPRAATTVDLGKFPACAGREKPSTAKPCRPAGTPSTNRDLPPPPITAKAAKSSTSKFVTLPVCTPGQRSTAAKPCIALKDNGPPSLYRPTPKPENAGPDEEEPPIFAARVNDHECEAASDGRIYECGPYPAPGEPLAD